MPATEMIVMVAAFTCVLLGAIQLLRLVQAWITHRTIRAAIEKDPATAESMIERVIDPKETSAGDDRTAVILVAFGVAMIGASLIAGDIGEWKRFGLAGALFPLLVGAGLWLRYYAIERARRGAGQ